MTKKRITEKAATQRLQRYLKKQGKKFVKNRSGDEFGFVVDVKTYDSAKPIVDYADFEQLLRSYELIKIDEEL